MKGQPNDRAIILGEYILEHKATVRATAKQFGISKSMSASVFRKSSLSFIRLSKKCWSSTNRNDTSGADWQQRRNTQSWNSKSTGAEQNAHMTLTSCARFAVPRETSIPSGFPAVSR